MAGPRVAAAGPYAAVEPVWPQVPGVAVPSGGAQHAAAGQPGAAGRRAEAQPEVAVTACERQAAGPTVAGRPLGAASLRAISAERRRLSAARPDRAAEQRPGTTAGSRRSAPPDGATYRGHAEWECPARPSRREQPREVPYYDRPARAARPCPPEPARRWPLAVPWAPHGWRAWRRPQAVPFPAARAVRLAGPEPAGRAGPWQADLTTAGPVGPKAASRFARPGCSLDHHAGCAGRAA